MSDRVGLSEARKSVVVSLREWEAYKRHRDALGYLADSDNWLGDPLDQTATLHGHFTPFELAQRALAGKED